MLTKILYNFLYPPLKVKKKSESYLIEQGAKICDWLPYISYSHPRTNKEISQRALILLAFFNIYLEAPFDSIKNWLKENNLLAHLSENEKWILTHSNLEEISENEKTELGWYVESLWVMLWAGSIIPTLDPESHVGDNLVNFVPNLQKNENGSNLLNKMRRRSYSELHAMLDLYYRAHWFARDGYWSQYDTGNFDLGIIQSRRRALEWIFDKTSDWDDIDLST